MGEPDSACGGYRRPHRNRGVGRADFTTADGRAVARTIAAWDAAEAERTAERIARAHRQRAEKGLPQWARRPFGHNRDGSLFEPEAEPIRDAAERLLRSATLTDVVRDWTARGIVTSGGKPWNAVMLGQMLRQPRLAGLLEYHGNVVGKGKFEPILTEPTWRALVATVDGRSGGGRGLPRGKNTTAGRLSTLLGGGLAVCGECGGNLTRRWIGGKEVGRRMYACSPRGCVVIDADLVDFEVFKRAAIAAATWDAYMLPRDVAPDMSAERERERTIVAQLDDLQGAIRQGQALATLLPVVADLERELDAIRAVLARADRASILPEDLPRVISEWQSRDLGERRAILGRIYQSIRVLRRYDDQADDTERVVTRFADGWLPEGADVAGREVHGCKGGTAVLSGHMFPVPLPGDVPTTVAGWKLNAVEGSLRPALDMLPALDTIDALAGRLAA